MARTGRPRIIIDWDLVNELSQIQCTQEEIAHVLGIKYETLCKRKEFKDIYNKGRETGKKSLRRLQWDSARKGNTSMLIWLGKQYLGQTDKTDANVTGTQTIIAWNDDYGVRDESKLNESNVTEMKAVV